MKSEGDKVDKRIEIAINFLLYSYFNITLESKSDTIIEKAIDKAYFDATNQKAFNALKKEGEKGDEKENGIDIIKKGIDDIFEKPSDFDKHHKEMCEQLEKTYRNVKIKDTGDVAFSYGNAQKWVNMTMKYLYVIGNVFLSVGVNNHFVTNYAEKINRFSDKLHIPVDSYILEALWNGYEIEFDKNNLPEIKQLKDRSFGKYSSEKLKPWSQWNQKDYDNFWEYLSSLNVTPIEWEGPAWIKVAQERNSK